MAKSRVVKSRHNKVTIKTNVVCGIGILSALAIILACFARGPWPSASFLEYSPTDVPLLIATFMYGPVAGVIMSFVVAVIQGVTVSASSGIIGIAMNFISMLAFSLTAGLIYKKVHTLKGAIIALACGALCGVVVMLLWNIVLTPLYMGVSRAQVIALLPTIFLPFNLVRYISNAVMTFILYKATHRFFNFAFKNMPEIKLSKKLTGEYDCDGEEETFALAKRVADTLKGGETVLLEGDLGAGKTTFTKGLAKALGVTEEVTSPTFTILNIYNSGRLPLYHADMYRVTDEDETYELGLFEDAPENAVFVVEWNKSGDLTERVIDVKITAKGDTERHFVISDSAENKDGGKQKPAAEVSESDADGDDGESCGAPEAEDGHSETPAAE